MSSWAQLSFEPLESRIVLSYIPPGTEFAADGLPLLSSDPSASVAIFLDFQYESRDGQKLLFNPSGSPSTIDSIEQEMIAQQWAKVSSAYAMFDVDVTTVLPDDGQPFIWAAIYRTPNGPGSGGGAVSRGYLPFDAYFDSNISDRFNPTTGRIEDGALAQSWIREGAIYTDVITHETGHSNWVNGHESADQEGERLGIQNLPIESGPFTRSTGPNGSWFNFTTEWTYQSNPNGFFYIVDDIEKIASVVADDIVDWVDPNYTGDGFRPDDHLGTIAAASAMTWDAATSTWVANGIVERPTDIDVLSFNWSGGTAWVGAQTALPNPLLDARFVVKDAAGNVIGAADPSESKQAAVRLNSLAPGTYYVEITGDGDYSELGAYRITASASLPPSLEVLAEIPFDGNSLADTSGEGHDGNWIGSSQWTTGPDGSTAARLSGANRVQVYSGGGNFSPNGENLMGRTFSFWFRADNVGTGGQQVLFEDTTAPGYRIYLEDGQLKAYAINNAGLSNWRGGVTIASNVSLNSNEWYHVALTHRTTFSEVEDTIALYLNGEEVARGDAGPVPKTDRFYVGSTSFRGAIDDVHIHSEVVPQHLIAEWANRSDLSQSPPVGAAPFTVTATTTHDTSSLDWNAVAGATGYNVFRSLDNQNFALVGTVDAATTSFDDVGLRGSQSYFYRVEALGSGNVGQVEAFTRAQPIRYAQYTKAYNPNPDDFWASKMDIWGHGVDGDYAMMLTFFGPDGHRDTGLRIESSTDGVNFTTLVTLPPNESVYYDNGPENNGLAYGETYTYRFTPIDDLGPVDTAAVILETEPLRFDSDNNPVTGSVLVNGIPSTGETLTADASGLADPDGLGAFNYQWQRDTGSGFVDIVGATSSAYLLDEADLDGTIRVVVEFIDGGGTLESVTSAATTPVAGSILPNVSVFQNAEDTVIDLSEYFPTANPNLYLVQYNTNPSLVGTSLVGDQLTLSYAANSWGTADITVRATNSAGQLDDTFTVTVAPLAGSQSPFNGTSQNIAADPRIQAEDYDLGGEGIAYSDSSPENFGGGYRTDESVDITGANDAGGGFLVGWIDDGEYLEYAIDMPAGTYDIHARVASANNNAGDFRLLIGDGPEGTNFAELGVFSMQNTGGWQSWVTNTLSGVDLAPHAGAGKVLRIETIGGLFNINWIEFDAIATPLPGDYNNDDTVDADDYAFWRSNFGATSGPGLAADGNGNYVVDAADYTIWRDNLGTSRASAAVAAPSNEPSNEAPTLNAVVVDEALSTDVLESETESQTFAVAAPIERPTRTESSARLSDVAFDTPIPSPEVWESPGDRPNGDKRDGSTEDRSGRAASNEEGASIHRKHRDEAFAQVRGLSEFLQWQRRR